MVKLSRVLAAAGLAVALCALPATALAIGGTAPPTNGGPTATPPSSGSNSGATGAPAHATVKRCSLYATSSSFGLECLGGDGAGDARTVQQILIHESAPTCWDTLIPDNELHHRYGYTPNPDAPYYVQTCLIGTLRLDRPPADQPGLAIDQQVIEIRAGAKPCFNFKESEPGKGPTPFPDAAKDTFTCIKSLTGRQQQVVTGFTGKDGQIPGIVIAPHPTGTVRTNEDIAYVDAGADGNGDVITRTPDLAVGGVTLFAKMTSYYIYPYGPDGTSGHAMVKQACTGTETVGPDDTRATRPDACWWKYPQSSGNDNDDPAYPSTYPFRAEADWTVYYRVDGADHALASFRKYDDLHQPVYDVQTLVIH